MGRGALSPVRGSTRSASGDRLFGGRGDRRDWEDAGHRFSRRSAGGALRSRLPRFRGRQGYFRHGSLRVSGDGRRDRPGPGNRPAAHRRLAKLPEETVYAVDGGVYDAGATIEWLGRIGLLGSVDELQDFAAGPAIERGVVFVPALSGLACPYWDRSAAGLWLGMSTDTSREDMCQAAVEGIALRTSEVIAAIQTRLPLAAKLSVDGGLTRSPYFSQFLADASGHEIKNRRFDELTAFGCAGLAALALGDILPPPTESDTTLPPRNVIAPIGDRVSPMPHAAREDGVRGRRGIVKLSERRAEEGRFSRDGVRP